MASCKSKLAKIRIDTADWSIVNDVGLRSDQNNILNELQNHRTRLSEGEEQDNSRLLSAFEIRQNLSFNPISNCTFMVMEGVKEMKGSSRTITELLVSTSMLIRRIII